MPPERSLEERLATSGFAPSTIVETIFSGPAHGTSGAAAPLTAPFPAGAEPAGSVAALSAIIASTVGKAVDPAAPVPALAASAAPLPPGIIFPATPPKIPLVKPALIPLPKSPVSAHVPSPEPSAAAPTPLCSIGAKKGRAVDNPAGRAAAMVGPMALIMSGSNIEIKASGWPV